MSKIRPTSRSWRKSPTAFAALIIIAILIVIAGIEMSRRLGARSNAPAGAGEGGDPAKASYPRELRDGNGATLKLMARPQRMVSQTLGTDEILLAICSPDRIVGLSSVSQDPQYSPIIEQARSLGLPALKSAEEILRLNPDLIFVASYSRAEVVDLLHAAGAPVFRFASYERIEDIKNNIRNIGYATGDDQNATALVAQMEREIDAVRARLPAGGERPRIMSYSGGVTAGAGTLFDDIIRTAGAINVTAEQGLKGFPKVSSEHVAKWDPDFLVTGAYPGKFDEARRLLLADPAIASSRAARGGKIIVLDNHYYLSVSHYVVRAIEALANGLHSNYPKEAK
ncbi:MAG TPA: ABC transporter substrate-binding protein [Blastocatellia bacterium]|jgi:iron complex transport system substrate-binding protein